MDVDRLIDGYICECCGQFAKEYKRRIYSTCARGLIHLYHLDRQIPDKFHHISSLGVLKGGGEIAEYWGLISSKPNTDNTKKNSGFWAITDNGRGFVERRFTVAKYCHVYNNHVLKFSGEHVTIDQALGKKFNYYELMANL